MLKKLKKAIYSLSIIDQLYKLQIQEIYGNLKNDSRHENPKSLAPFGYKIYSQCDEDGIIKEIFNRLRTTNRVFVEFGVGNGLENNTRSLLLDNWNGLWIEKSLPNVRQMKNNMGKTIKSDRLAIINSFITKDNINNLISSVIADYEIDLLSIDVDGNDCHIFNAIECISPRVVIIEYNAKFPPPVYYCMEYDESHVWNKNDYFGASLKFLEVNFKRKNYLLVGCNLAGTNAFFIREDLVKKKFLQPYTAENHFEPPRYYLKGIFSGHPSSYSLLEKAILKNPI
jgi:acetyltransferase-like isoleucine patch superfamily enzyme